MTSSVNPFKDLFLFSNRLKDPKADYFSVTDGYVWRRDSLRLVAWKYADGMKGNRNYAMKDFLVTEEERVTDLQITEEGEVRVTKEEGEACIIVPTKEMEQLQPHSLQTVFEQTFDAVFSMESKGVVTWLLRAQRKMEMAEKPLETCVVELDLAKQVIQIDGFPDKDSLEDVITIHAQSEPLVLRYSLIVLWDALFNAQSFGECVKFSVKAPYYTLIQHGGDVYTVINHRRKRNEGIHSV